MNHAELQNLSVAPSFFPSLSLLFLFLLNSFYTQKMTEIKKGSQEMFTIEDDWGSGVDYISDNDFDMIDRLSAALDQVTNQLEEKQREFVIKSTEWTTKTRERIKAQTKRLEDQKSRLQGLLVRQYDKIDKRMNRDAKTVRLRDKISFVVGVGNSCVAPALAIRYPNRIPTYYSIQLIILLILRYVIYRS